MPVTTWAVTLSVVPCTSALGANGFDKIVHPAHVWHRDFATTQSAESKQTTYLWCPGWAG